MRYSCASLANPLGGIHRLMAGPSTMPTTLKMATSAVSDKAGVGDAALNSDALEDTARPGDSVLRTDAVQGELSIQTRKDVQGEGDSLGKILGVYVRRHGAGGFEGPFGPGGGSKFKRCRERHPLGHRSAHP